jgi:hypothetical protein
VEIEPDFTPCDDALTTCLKKTYYSAFGFLIIQTCVMWMRADRGVDVVELFPKRNRSFVGAAVRVSGTHI